MENSELAHAREQIDALDAQIVKLLGQRAEVAKRVGEIKKGQNIYKPAREAQVIANARKVNGSSALPNESLEIIYKEIISACRNLQKPLRVAYLGPEGSYCQEAAKKICGSSSAFLPAADLLQAAQMAESGEADVVILPFKNSTTGLINTTQEILSSTTLGIFHEISLPIHHQLLTNAAALTEVKKVLAHPQALAQCQNWLAKNLPSAEQIATSSNSEAARLAAQNTSFAAIASTRAGEIYNLQNLAKNIQDSTSNATQFIALQRSGDAS